MSETAQQQRPSWQSYRLSGATSGMEPDVGETAALGGGCPEAADACQQLGARIESMLSRQQECQRSMDALAEEQAAFLRDVHVFASAQLVRQQRQDGSMIRRSETDVRPRATIVSELPQYVSSLASVASVAPTEESDKERNSRQRITLSTFHLKTQLSSLFNTPAGSVALGPSSGSWFGQARRSAKKLLEWNYFEPLMGVVIVINSVNIGWAIERELKNEDTVLQTVIEIVVLALFWAELALLFFAKGLKCLRKRWFVFDLGLNSATTGALIFAFVRKAEGIGANVLAETVKQMLILRILRLLRLFRAGRVIQMSRSLWKLVIGLKQCMGTMVAALLLISITLYIFACVGAELITKAYTGDPEVGKLVTTNFSSLPRIMLTLFQFISMDGTAPIYVTLIHHSPILCIYFLCLVIIVAIMLMDLITAVVVEDAITTASMDQEMKKHDMRERIRKLRPDFKKLFRRLDPGDGGAVQVEQIIDAVNSNVHIPSRIQDFVTPSRMVDFFDLLDYDGSGDLTESEFVEGLSSLALSDVPLETMQILHLIRCTHREVSRLNRLARRGTGRGATASVFDREVSRETSVWWSSSAARDDEASEPEAGAGGDGMDRQRSGSKAKDDWLTI